jgi:apolipoprotein N-acyltransferase
MTMRALLVALLAGAATAFGFAPFELFPVPIVTLAVLFALWRRTATPREAALLGFVWGMGCFLAGVSWVYVSLHDVGGMALPLAAVALTWPIRRESSSVIPRWFKRG